MYQTKEIFENNNPLNLKELLKSCIYNYYINNKTYHIIKPPNNKLDNINGGI